MRRALCNRQHKPVIVQVAEWDSAKINMRAHNVLHGAVSNGRPAYSVRDLRDRRNQTCPVSALESLQESEKVLPWRDLF
jgi:hypothetical protein